ncbi:ABC transporter substrate-binding protein [Pseudomonas typographi]|uniref:Nitrate ABC transporter substrate-binding protein n=1 Tax=Pseudomonas typographi TaxID=2715964 RepID=A0ABR7Z8B3_9PSED|nr:nitrate ABC transporter substrate-binding protein [Pseudomonas typographi]MBD1601771.1 nitrate ABC transporter substrate-binding protein [Pseudomonas typographi]
MADTYLKNHLTVAPNVPVFDLPIHVALEHGLFEKRGLHVQFSEAHAPQAYSSQEAFERQKESLYEARRADAYNLCEWAGLDRSERSRRGSQVHALRPAVIAQVIVSFDPQIQELRDLAGVPVGINEFTGSHYTTLQFLDGALAREDIVLVHIGEPFVRYETLKSGQLRAAALMEPYVSLALKEGAHIIGVNFYRGAEVIAPELPPDARAAYLEAVNEATNLINDDFARYKHYIIAPVKDRLDEAELASAFVRYAHSRPLDEARFAHTYAWMRSWNLTPGLSPYSALVAV